MVDNPFPNPIIPNFTLGHNISLGSVYKIEHDGFQGEVIGFYTTREGKQGVVMQQIGTRVVHVYGVKWLEKS